MGLFSLIIICSILTSLAWIGDIVSWAIIGNGFTLDILLWLLDDPILKEYETKKKYGLYAVLYFKEICMKYDFEVPAKFEDLND